MAVNPFGELCNGSFGNWGGQKVFSRISSIGVSPWGLKAFSYHLSITKVHLLVWLDQPLSPSCGPSCENTSTQRLWCVCDVSVWMLCLLYIFGVCVVWMCLCVVCVCCMAVLCVYFSCVMCVGERCVCLCYVCVVFVVCVLWMFCGLWMFCVVNVLCVVCVCMLGVSGAWHVF